MSPVRRIRKSRQSIYTSTYRRQRRYRAAGWVLVGIGAVMAIVHVVTHLGRLHIVGYQDLLLGYPMAAVLTIVGFVIVGSVSGAHR
ncbi:hypothetical protein BTO20_20690 [Mycobacterium dioxanotrophicus]|jgi:uncharacterized membrane protein|uniref:Uncharacterized protein n=1 Tax=Mycobacterium dioxanotrophicus TaxID=482462 RepID=A0A1Y0C679_9MYCO|nr:hypothetical protein [Mycobacterium dioxanotrophicus]ART70632.1 hypothetical protein BTO20_20690 [Mycobacterium dioxanotrophicus]